MPMKYKSTPDLITSEVAVIYRLHTLHIPVKNIALISGLVDRDARKVIASGDRANLSDLGLIRLASDSLDDAITKFGKRRAELRNSFNFYRQPLRVALEDILINNDKRYPLSKLCDILEAKHIRKPGGFRLSLFDIIRFLWESKESEGCGLYKRLATNYNSLNWTLSTIDVLNKIRRNPL